MSGRNIRKQRSKKKKKSRAVSPQLTSDIVVAKWTEQVFVEIRKLQGHEHEGPILLICDCKVQCVYNLVGR